MSISMLKFLSVACLPCYKNSVRDCTLGPGKIQSGKYKKIAALWFDSYRANHSKSHSTTVFVLTSHVYLTKFITLFEFVRFISSQANTVETLSLPTQFLSSSKKGVPRLKRGG
jgi:hypothetical protein